MMLLLLFVFGISHAIELESALEKAIKNYPSIKALQEERLKFKGKALTYRSYLNPTLSVEVGNFGTSKDSVKSNPVYNFSYSQPFVPYPLGKYFRKMIDYEEKAFLQRIELEKSSVIGQVYSAYYSSLYKKELLRVSHESYNISESIHGFIKRLFELGEVTKLEMFRSERELEMARVDLEFAKNEYKNSLKYLSSFVDEEVSDVEGKLDELRDMKDPTMEDLPRVKQYDLMIKGLASGSEVEKILAKPQFSWNITGEKVSSNEYGLRTGFTVLLPLFYERQGEIIQLSAQARSLEKLKELEKLSIGRDYQLIKSRYRKLVEEIKKIEELQEQGFSDAEISRIMGKPYYTVWYHRPKVKRRIKEYYQRS
ncbi:MAG: TolC family protein, partial [Aquificaceae bacterium]